MFALQEALARDRMRELQRQSRQARVAREPAAERRYRRAARRRSR